MTTTTAEQEGYLCALEDLAGKLQKTQANLKKCPKIRLTEGYVRARLECIEEHWRMFNKIHFDLTKCTPRDQRGVLPYFLNEEYYKYEEVYLCVKADLLDLVNKGQTSRPSDGDVNISNLEGNLSGVKLPRIQLPTFSGKYDEFPTYQDLFTSLVHNNTSISNVQKLHYLKTSLSGEAEMLLRHIQITDTNYVQAWNLLKGRYGNKRIIITSLLKRLFNQKKIITQSSSYIKSIMDTTTECLHSLGNLGISTESWDPIIVFLVVQKLDMQTHKEWEEYAYNDKSDELPKWTQLNKFLESKFRTLELITPGTSSREKSNTQKSFHVSNKDTKPARPINTTELQCVCTFCNGDHYVYHCKDFTKLPVEERHEFALNKKLCFNCLVPNHNVFRCRQRTSCKICRRKHHSLLHLEKKQQGDVTTATPTNEETDTQITTHYSREEQSGKKVLLATALVDVVLSNGESHVFRALIDQGSEASFITSRVADLLRLKRREVTGTVSGVGGEKQVIRHKVKLSIKSSAELIEVNAYVMKTISSYLPSKQVAINWSEIQNLSLADPNCGTPGKIDMLLGADVFSRIIEDGLIRLHNGLVAQNTRLGGYCLVKQNIQTMKRR